MLHMLNKLLSFFKAKPVPVRVQVLHRTPLNIRLADWRSDPDLVKVARDMFNNTQFQMMLDVLNNEHPGNMVLSDAMSQEFRIVHQGRTEGYTMALANLSALAQMQRTQTMPEATFEPEEPVTE